MPNIARTLLRFHNRLSADPHHRYRSWGHCYRYFRSRLTLRSKCDLDHSALQLGFYLASWGMYRGSSFLLWKDFYIHRFAIRELLRPKYDSLLCLRPHSWKKSAEAIPRILALAEAIRKAYRDHVRTVDGRHVTVDVSDTLATKIILGTLACIPAYDSYVVEGLRAASIPFSRLNERHLEALFEWYREHATEFDSVRRRIRENGLRYPPMKLVDMYLWETGRHISEAE